MSDAEARWTMIEFVCPQCLVSKMSRDDDPVPRCARCLIRMTPDDPDMPPVRPNGGSTRRPAGGLARRGGGPAGAL